MDDDLTFSEWANITADELRVAAKVARVSGGMYMPAAAAAWDRQADDIEAFLEEGTS